jgi:hypothetical protein
MVDDSEGEISVRGSPALTSEFFYVMRGMMVVTSCQKQLEEAPTLDERRRAARDGQEALVSVRDSLDRIPELLNELEHSPEARSMFAQTLAGQRELYEAARARFEAALEVQGVRDESSAE